MAKCPNCGRETYRTEDWACQWCGHPLLSGAFKKIDKTYRELQEERAYGVKPVLKDGPGSVLTPVAEPEPAAPPVPEPQLPQMPEPEPEIEPEIPAPPEPVAEAETELEVKSEAAPLPDPETETVADSKPTAPPEPVESEEEATAEAEPVSAPDSVAEPAAEIEPEVETAPAPTPVAATALKPEATTGIFNTTVEELNAAFNTDKAGANAKLMDKTLKVSGNVDKVFVRDNLDIFYIILAGAGGPSTWQIRCTFNREQSAHLSRLTEGQKATVQGIYTGYERNIILKECSLVQ